MFIMTCIIVFLLLCEAMVKMADCLLTVKPDDSVIILGDRAILRCTTDSNNTSVSWVHKSVGSETFDELLFLTGELYFEHRYYIINSSDEDGKGRFDLVIRSVTDFDAGLYRCRDRDGRPGEDFGEAELIAVRAGSFSCRADTSESLVDGDTLTMRCSAEYLTRPTSSNAVHIAWVDSNGHTASFSGDDSNHTQQVKTMNSGMWSIIESMVSVAVKATDNTSCCSQCVVKSSTGGNWSIPFNCDWTISDVTVQYPVRNVRLYKNTTILFTEEMYSATVGETIQCRADGNPPADYMWYEEPSGRAVSAGSSVSLSDEGEHVYRCSVSNVIRNITYRQFVEYNVTVRVAGDRTQAIINLLVTFNQVAIILFVLSNTVLLAFVCFTLMSVVCARKPTTRTDENDERQDNYVESDGTDTDDYDEVACPTIADHQSLRTQSDPAAAHFTYQAVEPTYSMLGDLSPPAFYQPLMNGQYIAERYGESSLNLTHDPTYCTTTGERSPPSFYEPLVIVPRVAPRVVYVARIYEPLSSTMDISAS